MKDKVLIFDFMNYLHRCRVGNLQGEYVLIFNFFRNLRATVERFEPAKIFFALEGYPKHRYNLFAGYKANRIIKTAGALETKNKIIDSAELIKKLLLLLPVTMVYHPDYEADDVISTLVDNMKDEDITIISADTDCIQILQRNYKDCKLYNPIKKEYIKPPEWPYIAFKSLVGDKSDNIAPIMSNKKAEKLIVNADEFAKFLSIEENRSKFFINRDLIEFQSIQLNEIIHYDGEFNPSDLKKSFDFMEFKSITNDYSWNKFCETFENIK